MYAGVLYTKNYIQWSNGSRHTIPPS